MVSSFSNSTQSASVAVVSGAGLRSRKVDKGRPLAVIRESDIPDLGADSEALNRVVSTVSTGVEKDEEEVRGWGWGWGEESHHMVVV